VQQKSPALLLGGGIAGVVGTVILASRATLKLGDVLDKAQADIDLLDKAGELRPDEYSDKDIVKHKAVVKLQLALSIAKLYGPSVALGGVSIALLVSSHNILNKRNAALTAAYAALDKSYRAYRARVVEELGEDKDREFIHAVKTEKVTTVNPETGKKVTTEEKTATGTSAYGVVFRRENPNWASNPDTNIYFLRCVQNYANDKLQRQGYFMLNDLYTELGVEKTKAGQVVGWVYDADETDSGDGFISLGVFDTEDPYKLHNYLTGREQEIWIDPNVDGLVYDKIDEINRRKKNQA
jgi:hypothetical protein